MTVDEIQELLMNCATEINNRLKDKDVTWLITILPNQENKREQTAGIASDGCVLCFIDALDYYVETNQITHVSESDVKLPVAAKVH